MSRGTICHLWRKDCRCRQSCRRATPAYDVGAHVRAHRAEDARGAVLASATTQVAGQRHAADAALDAAKGAGASGTKAAAAPACAAAVKAGSTPLDAGKAAAAALAIAATQAAGEAAD